MEESHVLAAPVEGFRKVHVNFGRDLMPGLKTVSKAKDGAKKKKLLENLHFLLYFRSCKKKIIISLINVVIRDIMD